MSVSARNPWQEVRRLQQRMEWLLGDVGPAWQFPLVGEYPPINITRGSDSITLEALCPGVDRQSFDVTVVGDAVTIRGERKDDASVPPERYHRRERLLGAFTRSISVGDRLDPDKTEASHHEGILRVQVSRAPETAPKKIPIKS